MLNNYQQKRKVVQEAIFEAAKTLERLKANQSEAIDIFKIIQNEGVWLMFQPMKNLYGFYLKQGETAGIQINSQHPTKLQRYTAAHELGHHVLRHLNSVDDEALIAHGYASKDLKEVAADAFAAHFLMPPTLVSALLQKLGLLRISRSLTAKEVYRMSLEMGVNYSAAVNHLANLKHVSREEAGMLRKMSPKEIKEQIVLQPLENSWAEIWELDKSDHGKTLSLRIHDDLKICLPENPTTGYLWAFDGSLVRMTNHLQMQDKLLPNERNDDFRSNFADGGRYGAPFPFILIDNSFETQDSMSNEQACGRGGKRNFTVRASEAGSHILKVLEKRSWEDNSEAADEFTLSLQVSLRPSGLSSRGLANAQKIVLNTTVLQTWESA